MTKELAKQKIKTLIERYNSLTPEEKRMNEETTKAKFIRPLFEALGWDFEEDVLLEDKISHGRVDYNFRIEGRTKFFLEAKPLKVDIDDLKYAKQAANYAWLRNVNWAVLTDFEGIRIFYPAERGQAKACLRLDHKDYLNAFDDLWILSRDSFKSDLINQQAAKWGAKPEQIKVSEQLAKDMNAWRQGLCKHFKIWNKSLADKDLDEGVQKILDRLIFIRSCEDRGLENDTLRSKYRIWQDEGRKGNFLAYLKPLFAEYQKNYNSGLFDEHPCMDWEISSECFDEIIEGLYRSKNGQDYNFSIIDADVLGGVYEQYLGHLLQKSGDGDISKKKRKSQGIYYTPTFIVEYIVQNTLGKVLQEKSSQEIANLKILDPACGSGSFMIKAFDLLTNFYLARRANEKFDLKTKIGKLQQAFRKRDGVEDLSAARKMDILRNNIYGVDLDQQAVEIAQLNLMLKTLERKQKLPHLNNIKCGNSLIDDPKIAGDKAFDWNEQFPEIMKNGGFDIIIGNPPYIFARGGSFTEEEKKYYHDHFQLSRYQLNTFLLFIEQGIKLLNIGGYFGFIVPNNWLTTSSFSKIREYILKNTSDIQIVNAVDTIFKQASVDTCILVFKKNKPNKIKLGEIRNGELTSLKQFEPKKFYDNNFIINVSKTTANKNARISNPFSSCLPLRDMAQVSTGLKAYQIGKGKPPQTEEVKQARKFHSKEKINSKYICYLDGRDVKRYKLDWSGEYLSYGDWLAEPRKSVPFNKPRILVRQIPSPEPHCINGVFTNEYYLNDINSMVIYDADKSYDLKYILGVLNSRLLSYWFVQKFDKFQRKIFPQFKVNELAQFPIFPADTNRQREISKLADRMLELNKDVQSTKKGTNCWNKMKLEIDRTDKQIDQMVYKLYDLTPKEITAVESPNKSL
ncbi:MAG TPA: N-6 DNA methylase [Patescibacteria group bacterium]|nr:N-6 DNA methylase [Patescibacteria group bacterium]